MARLKIAGEHVVNLVNRNQHHRRRPAAEEDAGHDADPPLGRHPQRAHHDNFALRLAGGVGQSGEMLRTYPPDAAARRHLQPTLDSITDGLAFGSIGAACLHGSLAAGGTASGLCSICCGGTRVELCAGHRDGTRRPRRCHVTRADALAAIAAERDGAA